MLVGLLNTKPTTRAEFLMGCFANGIKAHGDEVLWISDYRNFKPQVAEIDVALQVCFPNRHKSEKSDANADIGQFRLDVNQELVRLGKRAITIDTGFVKNQSKFELVAGLKDRRHKVLFDIGNMAVYEQELANIYYSVGFDGLKNHADYVNQGSPGDRWEKLQTPLTPWRERGKHILLMGQTYKGQSSQHVDIYQWYADVIRQLRTYSDKPIVFRHHPRITKVRASNNDRSRIPKDRDAFNKAVGTVSRFSWHTGWLLEDDLRNCWAAVGLTTNAMVECVIAGIPTLTFDKGCMAWPVTGHSAKDILDPPKPDRTQWAYDLAYAQWNTAEMRSGEAWAHLRKAATLPRSGSWGVTHV